MTETLSEAILENKDGLSHQQWPSASSRALGPYPVGEKPDEKIFTEKIHKRSVKMGRPKTLQMTQRQVQGGMCELKYRKTWQGSVCHPCQSTQSPEIHGPQKNGLHSDILALPTAAHWVTGCGKSSRNYHPGISQSKTHGVAIVLLCDGQTDNRTRDGRKLFLRFLF